MLPHSQGEEQSIAEAFLNCDLAFQDLPEDDLDEHAREIIEAIKKFMNVENVEGNDGKWVRKARTFDTDQKLELSRVIDELAHWFESRRSNAGT